MCNPYILAPTVCNFKRKLHFLFVTKLSPICLLQCSPFMSSLHYFWKFLRGFPHMLQNRWLSLLLLLCFFSFAHAASDPGEMSILLGTGVPKCICS